MLSTAGVEVDVVSYMNALLSGHLYAVAKLDYMLFDNI